MSDSSLIRGLVSTNFHFDGYQLHSPNSRDKPFFSSNTFQLGNYHLTTRLSDPETLFLEFQSVCPNGKITFESYKLSFDDYISKLKQAIEDRSDFIDFTIKPLYKNCNNCNNCIDQNTHCKYFQKEHPQSVLAAASFNMQEVQEALSVYYGIKTTNYQKTGGIEMSKKRLGLNAEMGLCKDTNNIKSTLMGIAFRNPSTGDWYTFDPKTNTRKNIAGMKFGDFPIMFLPATEVCVGDPIKKDGKYYYVKALKSDGTTDLVDASTGEVKTIVAEENLLFGKITLYTKVVAFDVNSLTDASSNQPLGGNLIAAMLLMGWDKEEGTEFSLDNLNDDSFNGLGAYALMAMNGNNGLSSMFGGNLNNLLPFMMLGDSDDNDMTKMMVLSQVLNTSNSGISLPGFSEKASVDLICSKCGTEATSGKFCTKCGGELVSKEAPKEVVICSKCGERFSNGEKFCKKCGAPTVVKNLNCTGCGTKLDDDANFCPVCGKKVTPDLCPICGKEINIADAFCSACGTKLNEKELIEDVAEIPNESATE